MFHNSCKPIFAVALAMVATITGSAIAKDLTISSALPQVHFWTGQYMDPFADMLEARTSVSLTRFYAGELVGVGRGLDALQGGAVDIVSPLLAPYHPGKFPLSDISQLPVYNTDSVSITKAFQKLLDSDVELKDGKTFYDYEVRDKGIVAWGLGATGPYAISTTGKKITRAADFKGLPIRAGAALQTMTLEQLGVTPVTMPASQAYEALTRGTLDGILLSVGDWKSYSLTEVLKFTIDGVALGHWESYHAISQDAWSKLSAEEQAAFDLAAREAARKNAEFIENQAKEVRKAAKAAGSRFAMVGSLNKELQNHIGTAALATWKQWIEQTQANGHPAKAAAVLWAGIVQEEGGVLPEGVAELLAQ